MDEARAPCDHNRLTASASPPEVPHPPSMSLTSLMTPSPHAPIRPPPPIPFISAPGQIPALPAMPDMNSARVTGEDRLENDLKFKMDEDEELAKLLRPDNVQENVAEDLEIEKLLKNTRKI